MALPTLTTPRLLLRDWKGEDADNLWEFASNPLVGPSAGWQPHRSPGDSARAMSPYRQMGVWAVALREGDKVVGTLELTDDRRRKGLRAMEIGYALSLDWWGAGLMTEAVRAAARYAFEVKGAQLVTAYCQPGNERSVHLLERCGFAYEGTLRGMYRRFDGEALDMRCYSVRPDEIKLK